MAYAFDLTLSQALTLPTNNIPSPTLPVTLAGWIYDTESTTPAERSFFGFGWSVNEAPLMRVHRMASRNVRAQHRDDSGVVGNTNGVSYGSANVWAHAGGVFNTSVRAGWVNGTKSADQTTTLGTQTFNRFGIAAMHRVGFTQYFTGRLAEIAVWSAYLSADEMIALSKGFKPHRIRPQSLLYYSPLIRDLQDLRGALTITNNNTATVADHPRVY
jgi:hypothetical protein